MRLFLCPFRLSKKKQDGLILPLVLLPAKNTNGEKVLRTANLRLQLRTFRFIFIKNVIGLKKPAIKEIIYYGMQRRRRK